MFVKLYNTIILACVLVPTCIKAFVYAIVAVDLIGTFFCIAILYHKSCLVYLCTIDAYGYNLCVGYTTVPIFGHRLYMVNVPSIGTLFILF